MTNQNDTSLYAVNDKPVCLNQHNAIAILQIDPPGRAQIYRVHWMVRIDSVGIVLWLDNVRSDGIWPVQMGSSFPLIEREEVVRGSSFRLSARGCGKVLHSEIKAFPEPESENLTSRKSIDVSSFRTLGALPPFSSVADLLKASELDPYVWRGCKRLR